MSLRIFLMEKLSRVVQFLRMRLVRWKGYDNISLVATLESGLLLDKVYPKGVYIGKHSLIAAGTTILTHEHVKRDDVDHRLPYMVNTYIGERCFVGVKAIILPGVRIGDEVIVGAGAVVSKDVPSNKIVVGNPGRILERNVKLDDNAVLIK